MPSFRCPTCSTSVSLSYGLLAKCPICETPLEEIEPNR